MKKRLLAVVMSLVLAMGLVACGSKETPVSGDISLEDLQAQIDELKAENEELKAQLGEKEEQAKVVEETWTDDTIIAFTNAEMVDAVRQITGIYDRDITAGDVKGITKIEYTEGHGLYQTWKGGLEPLKYFTGLVELYANTDSVSLEPIKNLTNLRVLSLGGANITDISALDKLTNLRELSIGGENVTDISVLANLTNLERLSISGENIDNISAISKLVNLQYLSIDFGYGITDIGNLDSLTNLKEMRLMSDNNINLSGIDGAVNLEYVEIKCNEITGIEELANLTNLCDLRVSGDGIRSLDFISGLNSLESLSIESPTLNIEESLPYLQKYEEVWRMGENSISVEGGGASPVESETCYRLW